MSGTDSSQWTPEAAEAAAEMRERFPLRSRVLVSASGGLRPGTVEATIRDAVRVRMDHSGRARWADPGKVTVTGTPRAGETGRHGGWSDPEQVIDLRGRTEPRHVVVRLDGLDVIVRVRPRGLMTGEVVAEAEMRPDDPGRWVTGAEESADGEILRAALAEAGE